MIDDSTDSSVLYAPSSWALAWALGASLCACAAEDHTDVAGLAASPAAASPAEAAQPPEGAAVTSDATQRFVLASINIDADGNRISYAQVIDQLSGNFDNDDAIEAPGNAVFLTRGNDFFYGLAESPTWVRYSTEGGF